MQLFKYWNFIGTLTEIETYVSKYENDDWNCAPIVYEADIYGLIKCRHNLPVNNYIFNDNNVRFGPGSFKTMEQNASVSLLHKKESNNIIIYVTGCSQALIAAINAAKDVGYSQIALKHFDKDTGMYLCQWVY